MKDWNRTFLFNVDEKVFFHIRTENGKAFLLNGEPEKYDVMLKIPSKVLAEIFTGRKDMNEAFAERQYEIIGPVQDGVRFRYLSEMVEKRHRRIFSLLRRISGLL
jgi:putative sterol carrier protein